MNRRWIALPLLIASIPLAGAQDVRTWTSASGKTIEASFVEQKSGQVILQLPGGEKTKINLNQLSSADQIYVGGQGRPAAAGFPPGPASAADKPVPAALKDLFGAKLVNAKGKSVSTAELDGKKIGVYFSASWCPPCRAFTPLLVAAYHELKTAGKPFEVVLVTSDKSEADMRAYMKGHDMPWLAVPFGDKPIGALKKKFGVAGIPKLVVVDSSGQTLSENARGEVSQNGAKAFDAW